MKTSCPYTISELMNVTKTFGRTGHTTSALKNISMQVARGEMVLLLGPSGSGKTTLLTLMAGLQSPTSGKIRLFGREISRYTQKNLQRLRAERIGFIFQTFHLLEPLNVLENICLVARFAGQKKNGIDKRARWLLDEFSIGHLIKASPRTLSQGEKQRVAVARAMINGAELILADEPTANLESRQGRQIIDFIYSRIKSENRSAVIVSHDERIARYADRVLHLEDGKFRE